MNRHSQDNRIESIVDSVLELFEENLLRIVYDPVDVLVEIVLHVASWREDGDAVIASVAERLRTEGED